MESKSMLLDRTDMQSPQLVSVYQALFFLSTVSVKQHLPQRKCLANVDSVEVNLLKKPLAWP
jgi:hypothetical protein